MKTLRLIADFTYDDQQMHDDDAEGKAWFFNDILKGNNLILNDIGDVGDCLGGITILDITERADTRVTTTASLDPKAIREVGRMFKNDGDERSSDD